MNFPISSHNAVTVADCPFVLNVTTGTHWASSAHYALELGRYIPVYTDWKYPYRPSSFLLTYPRDDFTQTVLRRDECWRRLE